MRKIVYIDFLARDILSVISAMIFPSNINLLTHYICLLFLQVPQTYFHQMGIENSKTNVKIVIKKKELANNIFFRSIKNLIQFGIGIKINLMLMKVMNHVLI